MVPATVKELCDKLLLPAIAQASEEEQRGADDITPWPKQPSNEFLYAVTAQLSKEEQDNHMVMDEDIEPLLQNMQ